MAGDRGADSRSREDLLGEIAALRERLIDLTAVMDAAPVGLCLVDRELRFRYVNGWLAERNGPSVRDHLGATIYETVPHVAEIVAERYRKVLDSGEPLLGTEASAALPTEPDFKRNWVISDYPVRGSDGSVQGVVSTVQDVTHVKRTGRKLKAILRAAPSGLAVFGPDLGFRYANAWFAEVATGSRRTDLVGADLAEAIPAVADQVLPLVEAVFRTGKAIEGAEITGKTPGDPGVLHTWSMNLQPVTGEEGSVDEVVTSVQDISARKHTERELVTASERLARAQEMGGFGCYDWNLTNGDLWWSDSMYALHGVSPETFDPAWESFIELVLPEDHEHFRTQLDHALVEPGPHAVEFRILKDGSEHVLMSSGVMDRAEDGTPVRFMGTVLDITDRVRDHEQLVRDRARLTQELDARTRELDRLLARMRRKR